MNWKEYKLNWGNKWRGKTLFQIYVNDFDYLLWMNNLPCLPLDIKNMIQYPIEHKEAVDPWSQSDFKGEVERE